MNAYYLRQDQTHYECRTLESGISTWTHEGQVEIWKDEKEFRELRAIFNPAPLDISCEWDYLRARLAYLNAQSRYVSMKLDKMTEKRAADGYLASRMSLTENGVEL